MNRVLKDYPAISLKNEDIIAKINFSKIFGRSGALHIEVGCGRGTFLVNEAKNQPDINFFGIEWASKYYRYTVDRIGRCGLANIRVIRTEAAEFLANFVPNESVDCFHIYFPDPWPKKKHHKRRFINQINSEQMLRALKKGGIIKIATDHHEYFQSITKVIEAKNEKLKNIEFVPTAGTSHGEWVGTNFEKKYIEEQREIYTMAVKKL